MNSEPLPVREMGLLRGVFERHREIAEVRIFGSRAKGTHASGSDVDLAVWGKIDALQGEALAAELDELPLPYRFDVLPFDLIKSESLREHIERAGLVIYPGPTLAAAHYR